MSLNYCKVIFVLVKDWGLEKSIYWDQMWGTFIILVDFDVCCMFDGVAV